jgi:hypothetical protein
MATTDELKAALLKAHRAGDNRGATLIAEQLRNQVARVPPVPLDDYLGQAATASADAINAGRQAVGFQNYAPGQDVNNEAPISSPNGTSVIPYVDRATEARAKAQQAMNQETRDSSVFDRAMLGAGKESELLLHGLKNIGNFGINTAANAWADKGLFPDTLHGVADDAMARTTTRNEEATDQRPMREALDKSTGLPGIAGSFLPYYLSGFAAGPVTNKIAGAGLKAVGDVASTPAVAARSMLGDLVERGASQGRRGPMWLNREWFEPASRKAAQKANSVGDRAINGMYDDALKQIVGSGLLGALENTSNPDRDAESGAFNGIAGGFLGAGAKPWLTRISHPQDRLVSNDMLETFKRAERQGYHTTPGELTGKPSLQVYEANLRTHPKTMDMLYNHDRNNQDKLDRMFMRGLGMDNIQGGLTHEAFANHNAKLTDRWNALREGTEGRFDDATMGQVDEYLKKLHTDRSPGSQEISDTATNVRNAMYGYGDGSLQLQPQAYPLATGQAVTKDLKAIYDKLAPQGQLPIHQSLIDTALSKWQASRQHAVDWAQPGRATRQERINNAAAAKADKTAYQNLTAQQKAIAQQNASLTNTPASDTAAARTINDINKLLRFNGMPENARFITPDHAQILNKHLAKLESLTKDSVGKPNLSYGQLPTMYDDVLGALKPISGNLVKRDAVTGEAILDGTRLAKLRSDLQQQISQLRQDQRGTDANKLLPLLDHLDKATKYKGNALIPNEEAARALRQDSAMLNLARENRMVNTDMRLDPTAMTKWVEGDPLELGNLLAGKQSIPQKKDWYDITSLHRQRLSGRKSTQNNQGSVETAMGSEGLVTPKDFSPGFFPAARTQTYLYGRMGGLIPKGFPASTGLLNLRHNGPTSIYPISHGLEQSIDGYGRLYRNIKELPGRASSLYEELMK